MRAIRPDGPAPAPTDLGFRRMRDGDVARVVEIERSAFAQPWSEELIRREMLHEWSTVLLACRGQGDGPRGELIVGFVIYWLVHDELHVLNVAVAPEARRGRVAWALMEETHERARGAGAALATLEVRRSNAAAIGLYRALGYRQAGVRPGYYANDGEDALVMERNL